MDSDKELKNEENNENKGSDSSETKKHNTQEMVIVNKTKKKFSLWKSIITILLLSLAAYFIIPIFIKKNPKTVVMSILTDQKVISQLSTLIVPYGGIYKETDEKDKPTLLIAYSGTVTYGIDFSQIVVTEEKEDKKIIIRIPDIILINVFVEPNSLSSMPEGNPDELAVRLLKCENDLRYNFEDSNNEMKDLAYESARDTLQNFFKPISDELSDEYEIIVE